MDSQTTQTTADEDAIRAIHQRMNRRLEHRRCRSLRRPIHRRCGFYRFRGDAPEGSPGDRVVPSADIRHSRKRHAPSGRGEVRTPSERCGRRVHSGVRVTLQRQTEASPSRDSMQLTVVAKRGGEWRGEGLMNARRLTMERQLFLDDIDSLPAEAQRQVTGLVVSLKKSHL